MRAILPGRPQPKRQALCTAYWDGLRLVAYISGNTAIILKGPRDIVQTLRVDHTKSLTAITIEESTGRLALCDEHRVIVYDAVGRDEDDLRWSQTRELHLNSDETVICLSWGSAEELLLAGSRLWLYHIPFSDKARLIWNPDVSSSVVIAAFSNDAEIISTCGVHDRLVKIWRRLSYEIDNTRFDASYLPHPAAVTSLHWRKPWHAEQNLDPLLYTFCSDNQIRLWTYSDPHSLSVMQLIATIDTISSIQPRRLSVGSISRRRYAFVLDSRDFSHATEKTLQRAPPGQINHGVEHLVEVANRSPEICVVLDGLGHMSAWGVENAGCKTKRPTSVFNVTLVDDVKAQLSFDHKEDQDYVQFCAFASGTFSASISLLVHSYTGQIDWHESPIADFFDTSSRDSRLKLMSSWAGHDMTVEHVARSVDDEKILSWSDEGQAVVWSQARSGALRRRCELTKDGILAVILFGKHARVVTLHNQNLALWNTSANRATIIHTAKLPSACKPRTLRLVDAGRSGSPCGSFLLELEDGTPELWQVWTNSSNSGHQNVESLRESLTRVKNLSLHAIEGLSQSIPCDRIDAPGLLTPHTPRWLFFRTDSGSVHECSIDNQKNNRSLRSSAIAQTDTNESQTMRATSLGYLAVASADEKKLSIWSMRQSASEWEHHFEGPDRIQKLLWTSTFNGQLLLFVSLGYHAMVIGQQRYSVYPKHHSWAILQDISLRDFTNNYISDASWLSSGDLAISAGNQIFVLECVCNKLSRRKVVANAVRKTVSYPKVTQIVDQRNTVLPVYSAAYLEDLLYNSHYDKIRRILILLYEKLKYHVEGDSIDSLLDHSPETWLRDTQGMDSHTNYTLEEVEDSFQDYLGKTTIWQLTDEAQSAIAQFYTMFARVEKHQKSLDENALRYLYAFYSTSPEDILPWKAFVFASRSSSQEALLDLVMRHYDSKITWAIARRTGLFIWLNDRTTLQMQFESVARNEYNKHEDRNPVTCSLYYLALNKKSILQGLWRMTVGVREKENTMRLLANNFDDPKWKATALKNAYALLSKRRFEYAAAFFLLGNSLKDAVNVCVNQLDDVQLAVALARVWEKSPGQSEEVFQDLVQRVILRRACCDDEGRWIAVWALTSTQRPSEALQAIVRPVHKLIGPSSAAAALSSSLAATPDKTAEQQQATFRQNDPHLGLVYVQIREDLFRKNKWTAMVLSQQDERGFLLRNVDWLTRSGIHLSALQLVQDWSFIAHQSSMETTNIVPNKSADAAAMRSNQETTNVGIDGADKTSKSKKSKPTQFIEPSADSLLDSFGF